MPAPRTARRSKSSKPSERGVLILHNAPGMGTPGCVESDTGVMDQVRHVAAALRELGEPHRIVSVSTLYDVSLAVRHAKEDVVFNLVEALVEPGGAAMVPAMCAMHGKACTGGSSRALQLTQDKQLTKDILMLGGLPVPRGVVVKVGAKVNRRHLPRGRVIVKPLAADASEGITAASVCEADGLELELAVRRVHEQLGQPALIEEFFGTRELQAALLEERWGVRVVALAEIDFSAFPPGKPRIVDYAAKWLEHTFEYQNTPRMIPAPVAPHVHDELTRAACTAWFLTACNDYARVDFRLDDDGRYVVLEVNVNPDISPDAGYAAALAADKTPFPEFVRIVVENARRRKTA